MFSLQHIFSSMHNNMSVQTQKPVVLVDWVGIIEGHLLLHFPRPQNLGDTS
jgi:hypothetical protein